MSIISAQNDDFTILQIKNGKIKGINCSGVKIFRGIPFALPPVGELRWKAPQPMKNWEGIRPAIKFGPRAMQNNIYGDMVFRSDSMSEDCLYLNVWTPSKTYKEKLPVLVYFHGGGFMAGSSDEPRYDGESLSRKGIVVVTPNYRLGIFGFFVHSQLSEESPYHSSGNYGYLDQVAALKWVKENIEFFGGDPSKIIIAGESAGSISVSALMCSPLSKDLISGAICSSGSLLGTLSPVSLNEAENNSREAIKSLNTYDIKALRSVSADNLLKIIGYFNAVIDGYFFPKQPIEIFKNGEQAKVPLLIGWNSEEMIYSFFLKDKPTTIQGFKEAAISMFADKAEKIIQLYGATTDELVTQAATDLASDLFIGFSTWKLSSIHKQTSNMPVFRYRYCHPRPKVKDEQNSNVIPYKPKGAVHSADIEYAMGNLSTNKVFDWQPEDYRISEIFQMYYVNFIKTGNPNGLGLTEWPPLSSPDDVPVLYIDMNTKVVFDKQIEEKYYYLDNYYYMGKY